MYQPFEFYVISTISVSGKEITFDNQPFRQVRNLVSVAMQPKLSSALGHDFKICPEYIATKSQLEWYGEWFEGGTSTLEIRMRLRMSFLAWGKTSYTVSAVYRNK